MQTYYTDDYCTIYHGDCRDILPGLDRVDLVLTDPPYGMGWHFTGQGSGKNAQGGTNSITKGQRIQGDTESFDPTHLVDYPRVVIWGFHHFPQHLERGSVLIWLKKYSDAYGTFLSDADLAWMKGGCGVYCSSVVNPASFQGEKAHPTQKPVSIMKWCIDKAGGDGLICDPYMGSGTTLRAAKDLQRKAIGIEIEEKYCEIAAKRLQQEVLPFTYGGEG